MNDPVNPGANSAERWQPSRTARTRRIAALVCLAVVIVAGLAVHGLLPDTAVTDIAGDALYAAAAYAAFVVVAARLGPLAIGGIAAAWCVGVELFQLTGLPSAWGASFAPMTLLLGAVFDARDLVVYIVTIAALTVLDWALGFVSRPRRA